MKKSVCVLIAGLAAASPILGQTVVERGPHHNLLQSIVTEEIDGQTVTHTNEVTQLGTGINFWDEQQNAWVPSSNEIEILPTGATYRKGQFKLIFAANINDANGNLEWFPTPNERIVVQTIGLALREVATGNSVFIAQIKDTQGFLTAPGEITYPACFDNLDADVRISVNPHGSGFQNDVILHERAPDPAAFGFRGECRIEVWHNILSGPEPELQHGALKRAGDRLEPDTQLKFTTMSIGPGTAFMVGAKAEEIKGAAGTPIPVAKQYFTDPQTQMRFLVEAVPLSEVTAHLQELPANRGALKIGPEDKTRMHASWQSQTGSGLRRPVSIVERRVTPVGERQIAAITRKDIPLTRGLLLDFTSLTDQSNYTLRGDITYLVATNVTVNLTGTTVIEPGCVIKFSGYNSANGTPVININGALDCQTVPYAPAVFTSCDDRTVGETNTAASHTIASIPYGAYHLKFTSGNANNIKLHDIRSRFAQNAFAFLGTGIVEAWNIQVVNTFGDAIQAGDSFTIRNALLHNVNNVIVASGNNALMTGEHLTVHNASKAFYAGAFTGCGLDLINSLLVVVTNASSSGLTLISSDSLASDAGVFQTVGAGAHYLADNTYRNAGSTSISTNLTQGIFKYSTTYPPIALSNNFALDTILGPQAQRDIDAPDKGYHYPALDWAVGNIAVNTGVTLTLTNGVAIAGFDVNALTVNGTAKLISEGRPLNLNRFVRYNTVQEQPEHWGSVSATMRLVNVSASDQISIRLTEAAHMGYASSSTRNNFLAITGSTLPTSFLIRDCEIYSSTVGVSHNSGMATPTPDVGNNFFHRSAFNFSSAGSTTVNATVNNNHFRYGQMSLSRQGSGTWNANNNLFDNCSASISYNSVGNSDNAYNYGATAMSGAVYSVWLFAFDYQTGVQGRWYYPTTGGNLSTLIDNGNTTAANAGLYHHTVRTDHTKDTSTVDIGRHYMATDTYGPPDGDGDGIPDYLEDRDGDGVADSGELNWTSPSNGATTTPALIVFTPLIQ